MNRDHMSQEDQHQLQLCSSTKSLFSILPVRSKINLPSDNGTGGSSRGTTQVNC
jgi:hypothetical protein